MSMEKLEKPRKVKKAILALIFILIFLVGSALLVAFTLMWQWSTSFISYVNAFYFAGFIWFLVGWMILMANLNILSPFIYGMKSFFLLLVGKKSKKDYYTYTQDIKENPIPKIFVFLPMISAVPNFIIGIVLHILFYYGLY